MVPRFDRSSEVRYLLDGGVYLSLDTSIEKEDVESDVEGDEERDILAEEVG